MFNMKAGNQTIKCLDSTKEQQSSIMTTVPLNKTCDQVALEKLISGQGLFNKIMKSIRQKLLNTKHLIN